MGERQHIESLFGPTPTAARLFGDGGPAGDKALKVWKRLDPAVVDCSGALAKLREAKYEQRAHAWEVENRSDWASIGKWTRHIQERLAGMERRWKVAPAWSSTPEARQRLNDERERWTMADEAVTSLLECERPPRPAHRPKSTHYEKRLRDLLGRNIPEADARILLAGVGLKVSPGRPSIDPFVKPSKRC